MNSIFLSLNFIYILIIAILTGCILVMQRRMAMDELTGLRTRKELMKHLERRLKRLEDGEVLLVSMIDLDEFKQINDTRGHMEGDRCLRVFAGTLKKVCGSDSFLARYGGDEFVIAGKEDREAEIRKQSELSFSMGTIEIRRGDHKDAAAVIAAADRAMYEEKRMEISSDMQ